MNKKSYRAKKADSKWDKASQDEEAAGIRARQQRERGGEGRILPYIPPRLPNRPSAKDTAAFKSQCRVAYTALKFMVGHIDKFPDWFDDPTTEEIEEAFHTCEGVIGK
jgi:hypothetical protein